LVGRAEAFEDGVMHFAPDLAENIAQGDANYLSMLDAADAYITRRGLNFPEEPDSRKMDPDPQCVIDPIRQLTLAKDGVTSIIWSTGYALDFR
jgi:putative flavoprotein involved in K+ transport